MISPLEHIEYHTDDMRAMKHPTQVGILQRRYDQQFLLHDHTEFVRRFLRQSLSIVFIVSVPKLEHMLPQYLFVRFAFLRKMRVPRQMFPGRHAQLFCIDYHQRHQDIITIN
jgi:hypothetical protein